VTAAYYLVIVCLQEIYCTDSETAVFSYKRFEAFRRRQNNITAQVMSVTSTLPQTLRKNFPRKSVAARCRLIVPVRFIF